MKLKYLLFIILFLLITFILMPNNLLKIGDIFFDTVKLNNICIKKPNSWHLVAIGNKFLGGINLEKISDNFRQNKNTLTYVKFDDGVKKFIFIDQANKKEIKACKDKNSDICIRTFQNGIKEILLVKKNLKISGENLDIKEIYKFKMVATNP